MSKSDDSDLVILSTGRIYSSIDQYSYSFSSVSGFPRIILRTSKDQLSSEYISNLGVFNGAFKLVPGDGWSFNIQFGSLIYRKAKKLLNGKIAHYTTFGLPILNRHPENIVTIHDTFFLDPNDEAYSRYFNISKHFLNRFLTFKNVVAPSEVVKKSLINYGFSHDIEVIYLAPRPEIKFLSDKEGARKALGLPLDKTLILSVSSGLRRKNLKVVQEVIHRLDSQFRVVRVGPPLAGAINLGQLPIEKLNFAYNACDVFLFPTLAEGYGIPLIESMATGIPIVATDLPITREVAGEAAILTIPDLTGCLEGISRAIDLSEDLRVKGFRRSEKFSEKQFSDHVNSYYSCILKRVN
jgi:glycosyltransferase involved in cell wall biosynthesis